MVMVMVMPMLMVPVTVMLTVMVRPIGVGQLLMRASPQCHLGQVDGRQITAIVYANEAWEQEVKLCAYPCA